MHSHTNSVDRSSVNVGKKERAITALAGSLLLYHTIKKHKADSLLLLGGGYLLYRAVTGHCPLYSLREQRATGPHNINVRTRVVVNRARQDVYAFWRNLENLPLFMKHLAMVRELDESLSTWTVRIPGGLGTIQWDAEIVKDIEGSELSWQSLEGASIANAGKVNFTDTPGNGTCIDVMITYRAPLGTIGEGISRLLTPALNHTIKEDIRGFKYYIENYHPLNSSF
jgi:uncharacterized membrane protein